jgi:hypothetical protein
MVQRCPSLTSGVALMRVTEAVAMWSRRLLSARDEPASAGEARAGRTHATALDAVRRAGATGAIHRVGSWQKRVDDAMRRGWRRVNRE